MQAPTDISWNGVIVAAGTEIKEEEYPGLTAALEAVDAELKKRAKAAEPEVKKK